MNIPIVLPVVHVQVSTDGTLTVQLDGTPYATDRHLGRGDLRALIEEITTTLDSPVRIDVREADGTSFSDIAMPTEHSVALSAAPPEAGLNDPRSVLSGAGFQPGEQVALAYLVSQHTADATGATAINLPPAIVAAAHGGPGGHGGLVLLGLTSQVIALVEPTAAPA